MLRLYRSRVTGAFGVLAALAASAVNGQIISNAGDVQLQSQDGKIVIGSAVVDEGSEVTQSVTLGGRVFTGELRSNFRSSNPGFNSEVTGSSLLPAGVESLGPGTDVYFDIVPFTVGSRTANFFYWDGADPDGDGLTVDDVAFGAAAPDVTWGLFAPPAAGASATVFEADGGPGLVPGGLIDRTSTSNIAPGRLHEHRTISIDDGDGNIFTDAPDGIYVAALQLRADGFETSDPFLFVHQSRNFNDAALDLAAQFLDNNFDALFGVRGDFNFDTFVNAADFTVFRDGAAAPGTGLEVFDEFAANFGAGASQAGAAVTSLAVPEPATGFGLAWIAGVAMARRRR